jgi:hypothetical protein
MKLLKVENINDRTVEIYERVNGERVVFLDDGSFYGFGRLDVPTIRERLPTVVRGHYEPGEDEWPTAGSNLV